MKTTKAKQNTYRCWIMRVTPMGPYCIGQMVCANPLYVLNLPLFVFGHYYLGRIEASR